MARGQLRRRQRGRDLLVAAGAFAAMEPFAYAAHRWVMHGPGWGLHSSHHRRHPPAGADGRATAGPGQRVTAGGLRSAGGPGAAGGGLEANDWFPVVFAALTVAGMALGSSSRRARLLLSAGAGVTGYGLVYAFVHDVYIHRRLSGRPPRPGPPGRPARPAALQRLRTAHQVHHLTDGEPFGMLWPTLPARAKEQNTVW